MKVDVSKGCDLTALALNMSKDAWLLHRQQEVALVEARLIYHKIGNRIAHMNARDELTTKGFYSKHGRTIQAAALMNTNDAPNISIQLDFIDIDVDQWHFEDNFWAQAVL